MAKPDIPHFSLPFRLETDGHVAVSEQDTTDEIADCCEMIVRTEKGMRIELPAFGVPSLLFQRPDDPDLILNELTRWEPRAEVAVHDGWDLQDFIHRIRIDVLGGQSG